MKNIYWSKLEPYSGDNKKSFEELCYQVAREEFDNKGVFTSIDDSGGGDGVEFYITLPNGDEWGWQAKIFGGNGRLSEGGRKEQIKKSLQTAYKKHPNLKKWFFCSKSNFTSGEKSWFENNLPQSKKNGEIVVPTSTNIELIHWGESEFINFLRQYPDIHNFFFSENLLTQSWFEERYKIDIETSQIKAKYESRIHISTDIDNTVNKILGGKRLTEILDVEMENQQVVMYAEEYKNSLVKLFSEDVEDEYKDIQSEFRKLSLGKSDIIEDGINKLKELKQLVLNKDEVNLKIKIKEFEIYIKTLWYFYNEYDRLTDSKLCKPINYLREEREEVPLTISEKERTNFINRIFNFFNKIFIKKETEKNLAYNHQKKNLKKLKKKTEGEARQEIFFLVHSTH